MKIHRYIYTRLSKAISPWSKEGFQSAFLPHDLLIRGEVLQIESCIHFPENLGEKVKSGVFYLKGAKQTFLVVLFIVAQPEEKDDHGRSGIFLCEGFLLEEKDWRSIRNVGNFWTLLLPQRLGSLPNVFGASGIDFKAGSIDPINCEWVENGQVPPKIEVELMVSIYHLLTGKYKDLSIIVEGQPHIVSQRIAPISRLLPDTLRTRLGWDDAFDGGKIFFSPLKLFGYQETLPVTGKPVRFAATVGEAPLTEPDQEGVEQPSDPFSRWLLEVCDNPQPQEKLNALYALSEAMVAGTPTAPDMESDPIFEHLSSTDIGDLFANGITAIAGKDWLPYFEELIPHSERLQLWMKGFPREKLAEILEKLILDLDISPVKVKTPSGRELVQAGSAALQALATLWAKEIPAIEAFSVIPAAQRGNVLSMLVRHGEHKKLAYEPLLAHFHALLPLLSQNSQFTLNLRPYLEAKIPLDYYEFRNGLISMSIELGDFRTLIGETIDWLALLDQWLVTHGGDVDEWKAAKQLAKTTDMARYVHLQAFALGEGEFPSKLRQSVEGRRGYLQALMRVHGYKAKQLQEMGFGEDEIEAASEKGGIFGKIKRLFGG